MITGHFEAQKHAFRQTSKGVVVSFLIHPQDLHSDFLASDIGTRFQIGYAEINDTEIPNEVEVGDVGGDGDGDLQNAVPADWVENLVMVSGNINNPFAGG